MRIYDQYVIIFDAYLDSYGSPLGKFVSLSKLALVSIIKVSNSGPNFHFRRLIRIQISIFISNFLFECKASFPNYYSYSNSNSKLCCLIHIRFEYKSFVSGLLFKFKTSFRVGRTILIRIYCRFLLECKFDYYTISKFRFQILIRIRISLGFRLRIRKWSFEFEFEQLIGNQALNLDSNKN